MAVLLESITEKASVQEKPGEIIHADLAGSMQEISLEEARYFLCFKDDFSKFRGVFFFQQKREVAECLTIYL